MKKVLHFTYRHLPYFMKHGLHEFIAVLATAVSRLGTSNQSASSQDSNLQMINEEYRATIENLLGTIAELNYRVGVLESLINNQNLEER